MFHFPIYCVQIDNGQEFTKRLSKTHNPTLTLFEKTLKKHGILHKLIKSYTPRHNGKVERSHKKITDIFTQSTLFILSMILKSNWLFTTENITISPCVLLTGILLLITLILSYSMVNWFKLLFCNPSLTETYNSSIELLTQT